MIHGLHPSVQGGPNAGEQVAKRSAGGGVGPAVSVIPLARQLDDLPRRDLDCLEFQLAVRAADHSGDGIRLPPEDFESVTGRSGRLFGNEGLNMVARL